MNPDSASQVPAPWTPLQTVVEDNIAVVNAAGRTYTFGPEAALPTAIHSNGVKILAAPIRLVARIHGEEVEWEEPYVAVLQQDAASAVLCGAMQTTGVLISNSVKIEYDGAIRFDMAITPWLSDFRKGAERAAGLEQLWLEIPLREEYCNLYSYWPLETGGVVSVLKPINSNALPDGGLTLPFKPFLWLGNEDSGLSFFCESDKGWQPHDAAHAIEVLRENGIVTLRLRLLDSQPHSWLGNADQWYKPNAPVTISFGLQATPVKPVEENALAYRMVHFNYYEPLDSMRVEQLAHKAEGVETSTQTVLDRAHEAGANVVVLHEAWNTVQNHWLHPNPDHVKATVLACHERGLKVLPYFGYELSTLAPEWAQMHDEVLIKNADGRYRGGWQRLPPQRDYMVCYGSAWQEKWLAGIEWMMDEYGFDGVYLDGTSTPSACANERHGCGYEKAGERVETFPIFRLRTMFQRLYEIVSARDGIITTHQSSCCSTPTLAYSHTYWDGEHIGGAFAHDADGKFPLEVFRAEFMGRNFGIQSEFLSGQPEAIAYCLIHNVMVRPGVGGMLDLIAPIWKAFEKFGTPQAHWLPYWNNAHFVQTDSPHVHVSAYVREERVLLALANLSADAHIEAAIQLAPQAVNRAGEYSTARDAISGEPLVIEGNRVLVPCAPMGWRLIEI